MSSGLLPCLTLLFLKLTGPVTGLPSSPLFALRFLVKLDSPTALGAGDENRPNLAFLGSDN